MEWHTFQSFSYAECGFPHSGYRSGSIALYLIHEFLFLNFQIHRISTLSFRLSSIDKSDNMLHSPSGFPSRISCRIIGCDFSSLDTFTYCLLKAVFHKYHAAEFIMRWRLLGAHSPLRSFHNVDLHSHNPVYHTCGYSAIQRSDSGIRPPRQDPGDNPVYP